MPAAPALVASYDDLQRHVGAVSEQHRNYVVVRIPADRELARAAKAAGGGDAGLAAVVAREVDGAAARLERRRDARAPRPRTRRRSARCIASQYRPDRRPTSTPS